MSLSVLFAAGEQIIDTELDALFRSNSTSPFRKPATAISVPVPGSSNQSSKKRKLQLGGVVEAADGLSKRSKSKQTSLNPGSISDKDDRTQSPPKVLVRKKIKELKVDKRTASGKEKKAGKGKAKEAKEEADNDEANSDLENAYLGVKTFAKDAKPAERTDSNDSDDSDDGGKPRQLVHESLQTSKRGSHLRPKTKFVPADETPELRDSRTIFVGNLSVEVAQKRPFLKQLQRHMLTQIPTAKIESTRFRSIPFQNPTSKLPTSDEEGAGTSAKHLKSKTDPSTAKQARPHDRDRASSWRNQKTEDDDGGKSDEKMFLNPKQKKKIAFINQEFHSTANTVNAYIVFAHSLPVESRPSNLPPPPSTLDPYEAARLAVKKCDGTVFMERMIRVDLVSKKGLGGDKVGESHGTVVGDPKLSVFVGNLDFASKEEDLRVLFEGVVSAERGPPGDESDDQGKSESRLKKPKTWVTRVRIVRDKETQLGKGFAYVQFSDRECVDEVLALEEVKLKFAKRKLRVQRCKTLPGSSTSTRQSTLDTNTIAKHNHPAARSAPVVPIVVPKGDPSLGEKLAHLPKEARKQYKSSDADRVARRLAKKKARIALGNDGVKTLGKDRERVRKGPAVNKGVQHKKESKGRVRSDKSLAKRNAKK